MHRQTFSLRSSGQQSLHRIDHAIDAWLQTLDVDQGIAVLTATHTTAGLVTTNHKDPASALDVAHEVDRLVPTRVDFHHHLDTPRDAAGHVKTAIIGASTTLPIVDGQLRLGGAQGIFFAEFDGPRDRRVEVYVLAADQLRESDPIAIDTVG
jgi:secondary thiamine-phosphate synthase enzyme